MRLLVNDVSAESSGALIILDSFYQQFCKDASNEYFLCLSTPSLQSVSNVTVLSFPWVKKSWFHRLWFDFITAARLIKEHRIDEVFSLQNICLPITNKPQTLYLQLSLPFEEKRFGLFEAPVLWLYQNVVGLLIVRSVKRAKILIVQTNWMKAAVINRTDISGEKITVQPPKLDIAISGHFSADTWQKLFFYPATPFVYKNHKTLFRAMQILKAKGIQDFNVLLTIDKEKMPKSWADIVKGIEENITFLGSIPHQEVMRLYCETVLVFPSYLETYGLPLKEASLCCSPIIAADRPFSREILSGYGNTQFFDHMDAEQLADKMLAFIDKKGDAC